MNSKKLKSQFRDSAPELVRRHCKQIESLIHDQEVTIQFQCRPQGLEFTIAGLEDGVAAALQLINKDFQVYTF